MCEGCFNLTSTSLSARGRGADKGARKAGGAVGPAFGRACEGNGQLQRWLGSVFWQFEQRKREVMLERAGN